MAFPRATLPGYPAMVPTARDANNQHTIAALQCLQTAQRLRAKYDQVLTQAIATYGDRGPIPAISGIYAEHFPTETKDVLRSTAHAIGVNVTKAYVHWQATGRRARTLWPIAEQARQLPDGRVSYY